MDRKKKARRCHFGLCKGFRNSRKQNYVVSSKSFLLHFPAICKAGGKKILELIQIRCRECGVDFCICRRCYRGQAYCCKACQVIGYRKRHREAQKRYREKEKGKQKRSELEKNRRWRRYEERENKKSVENKKMEYEVHEVEDCYGNGNGNGNGEIQSQSLYTQVQVRFCISNISNDRISTKRKKLGEKGSCHLCGCEGIIVEKFHRRGYSTKSSCA